MVNRKEPEPVPQFVISSPSPAPGGNFLFQLLAPASRGNLISSPRLWSTTLPVSNTKICKEKCVDVLVRRDVVSCFGLFQVCQRGQESRCEANTGAVPTLCNRIGCQGRNLAMNYCYCFFFCRNLYSYMICRRDQNNTGSMRRPLAAAVAAGTTPFTLPPPPERRAAAPAAARASSDHSI